MYSHVTPDDGSFTLHPLTTNLTYKDILEHFRDKLYKGDGFSVNQRRSGLFTSCVDKIGRPFCADWNYTPKRYIYQPFDSLLETLRSDIQHFTPHTFTEAIVNVYGEGDFIAYHKDYHEKNVSPISVVCSFEENADENHILEFYRTLNDPKTTKKDRSIEGYTLRIPLPNRSAGLMEGMQRRYVHMVHPGKSRISIVFRGVFQKQSFT